MTAAGLSSRMGEWKMMLPWGSGGATLLDTSLSNALRFCHRVLLVTGFRGAELAARYQSVKRIQILHNPDYETGLLSSQHLAAQAVTSEYCFLTHGDVPFLTPLSGRPCGHSAVMPHSFPVTSKFRATPCCSPAHVCSPHYHNRRAIP